MRCLVTDNAYYEYLDGSREENAGSILIASMQLVNEFPNLKREEAKAVYLDWMNQRVSGMNSTDTL